MALFPRFSSRRKGRLRGDAQIALEPPHAYPPASCRNRPLSLVGGVLRP